MKILLSLFLTLSALLAFACSAEMPTEDVGATQEAIGTCPRPTGGIGDTVSPTDSYIHAIGVDPLVPWRLIVKSKLAASPYTITTSYVDFGGVSSANSQAHITGLGWSSGAGRHLDEVMFLSSETAYAQTWGCANDSTKVCMLVSETGFSDYFPILYFDKAYGSPEYGSHVGFGAGLTAIVGMGATLPQKLRFYWNIGDASNTISYRSLAVAGPKIDACAYP